MTPSVMQAGTRMAALAMLTLGCTSAPPPGASGLLVDASSGSDGSATDAGSSDAANTTCTNTPAGTTITPINTVPATLNAPAVTAFHVVYVSTGGLHIHGQICVPESAGPHSIVVFNHGGVSGLANEWAAVSGSAANQCYSLAAAGAVVVMTQYRGESDALGGSLGTLQSDGQVEFCSGEVDDSLALLAIAQQRCDTDRGRVGVWGASHGGCVTLETLRRNVPGIRAGVAMVAPTDMTALYGYHVAHEPGGDGGADSCDPITLHKAFADGLIAASGTPATDPGGYAARSVLGAVGELASIPFMVIYGVDDCIVPFSNQACPFQSALREAGVPLVNYHLDPAGAVSAAPVAGCPGFGPMTTDAWPPPGGFSGPRYFIALDAQDHGFTGPAIGAQRALEALDGFFQAHL